MRVANDELDAVKTATSKGLQELGPKDRAIGVADGDDDSAADDSSTHPGFDVGGVTQQVGKGQVGQGSRAELVHLLIERRTDPRDLGLGDPGVDTEGRDQVVDLARRDPVIVTPP